MTISDKARHTFHSGYCKKLHIPHDLIQWQGLSKAALLAETEYWSSRNACDHDGWFSLPGKQWEERTGLNRSTISRAFSQLESNGWVEIQLKKVGNAPKNHYRITDKFYDDYGAFIQGVVADCTSSSNKDVANRTSTLQEQTPQLPISMDCDKTAQSKMQQSDCAKSDCDKTAQSIVTKPHNPLYKKGSKKDHSSPLPPSSKGVDLEEKKMSPAMVDHRLTGYAGSQEFLEERPWIERWSRVNPQYNSSFLTQVIAYLNQFDAYGGKATLASAKGYLAKGNHDSADSLQQVQKIWGLWEEHQAKTTQTTVPNINPWLTRQDVITDEEAERILAIQPVWHRSDEDAEALAVYGRVQWEREQATLRAEGVAA